jgi:hypothetical protein
MCVVCKEWEKGKLTNAEALRAIGEMPKSDPGDKKHLIDLASRIMDKEVPMKESDTELDSEWEKGRGPT